MFVSNIVIGRNGRAYLIDFFHFRFADSWFEMKTILEDAWTSRVFETRIGRIPGIDSVTAREMAFPQLKKKFRALAHLLEKRHDSLQGLLGALQKYAEKRWGKSEVRGRVLRGRSEVRLSAGDAWSGAAARASRERQQRQLPRYKKQVPDKSTTADFRSSIHPHRQEVQAGNHYTSEIKQGQAESLDFGLFTLTAARLRPREVAIEALGIEPSAFPSDEAIALRWREEVLRIHSEIRGWSQVAEAMHQSIDDLLARVRLKETSSRFERDREAWDRLGRFLLSMKQTALRFQQEIGEHRVPIAARMEHGSLKDIANVPPESVAKILQDLSGIIGRIYFISATRLPEAYAKLEDIHVSLLRRESDIPAEEDLEVMGMVGPRDAKSTPRVLALIVEGSEGLDPLTADGIARFALLTAALISYADHAALLRDNPRAFYQKYPLLQWIMDDANAFRYHIDAQGNASLLFSAKVIAEKLYAESFAVSA